MTRAPGTLAPAAPVGTTAPQPPAPPSGPGENEAGRPQAERVHALLASVREIVLSLGSTSAQLEREVTHALEAARATRAAVAAVPQRPAGPVADVVDVPPAPSAPHAASEAQGTALREAVEQRAVIEQAKGMLMLKHRCDADAAAALLLEISRRERRKVREVATDLVRAGSRPARPAVVDLTDGGSHATARR